MQWILFSEGNTSTRRHNNIIVVLFTSNGDGPCNCFAYPLRRRAAKYYYINNILPIILIVGMPNKNYWYPHRRYILIFLGVCTILGV